MKIVYVDHPKLQSINLLEYLHKNSVHKIFLSDSLENALSDETNASIVIYYAEANNENIIEDPRGRNKKHIKLVAIHENYKSLEKYNVESVIFSWLAEEMHRIFELLHPLKNMVSYSRYEFLKRLFIRKGKLTYEKLLEEYLMAFGEQLSIVEYKLRSDLLDFERNNLIFRRMVNPKPSIIKSKNINIQYVEMYCWDFENNTTSRRWRKKADNF